MSSPNSPEAVTASNVQRAEGSLITPRPQDAALSQENRNEIQPNLSRAPWDRASSFQRRSAVDTEADLEDLITRMEDRVETHAQHFSSLSRQPFTLLERSLPNEEYSQNTPIPRLGARHHRPSPGPSANPYVTRGRQMPIFHAPNIAPNGDSAQEQATTRARTPPYRLTLAFPFGPSSSNPPPTFPVASSVASQNQTQFVPPFLHPATPTADPIARNLIPQIARAHHSAPTPHQLRVDILASQILVGDTLIVRNPTNPSSTAYKINNVLQPNMSQVETMEGSGDQTVVIGGTDAVGEFWSKALRVGDMVVVERPAESWLRWLRIWAISAHIQLGSRTR